VSKETSVDNDALLRRHGVQVTAQRLAVLRAVSDRPHSTADGIYTVVRAEIGAISPQAVYDALAALTDEGLFRCIQPAATRSTKPRSSTGVDAPSVSAQLPRPPAVSTK
jgi:Fe2+ or Zn2+ uptake regulation protein